MKSKKGKQKAKIGLTKSVRAAAEVHVHQGSEMLLQPIGRRPTPAVL